MSTLTFFILSSLALSELEDLPGSPSITCQTCSLTEQKTLIILYLLRHFYYISVPLSGSITSWQIGRETMETGRDFIFGGSKITADGGYSHEIKGHLLLGRKAVTSLDSILKSRDITLSTKVHLVKAMVFPVVMYGCESGP